jgi:hypothetical protein
MLFNNVIAVELLWTRKLTCLWAEIEPGTSKIQKWSVNSLTIISPLFLLYSDFSLQKERKLLYFETAAQKNKYYD